MLRAGCLHLEIEKGRQRKPPVPLHERLCKMCLAHLVEDERHFIMDCSLYDDQRHDLFEHCISLDDEFASLNTVEKFTFIMKKGSYNIVKTVFKMFTRRNLFV